MKSIKTVMLIIMTMVSLVLVVGCGSNTASNLEGTYQTKFIDKKDGSKILEVATIKKYQMHHMKLLYIILMMQEILVSVRLIILHRNGMVRLDFLKQDNI